MLRCWERRRTLDDGLTRFTAVEEATEQLDNRRVYVTGGSGFVGGRLIHQLAPKGYAVTAAVRGAVDTEGAPTWGSALAGHDVVVHCAARVHVMDERCADPLAEFRRVNVQGTLNLARQAAAAGVKRFIFISSIKVNGEQTAPGRPFTAFDAPAPRDAYGISKAEAEAGLRQVASETGMQLVIIRPVLVYGPGVKGNFRSMLKWLGRGVPLPLGAVDNRRSLVSLDNLVDLIMTCIDHRAAVGQIFLVSDGVDLSTPQMLRCMGRALGKRVRLLPVPAAWIECCAALAGKRSMAQRLCGSLQVDIGHTCETLEWTPPVTLEEGFRAANI